MEVMQSNNSSNNKRPTVLLIDDDRDQLFVFEALLKKDRFNVISADSAREGLNALRDINVDVVVCDVMMPQMNGKDFVSLLRKLDGVKTVPVIALTAGSRDLETELLEVGADKFCLKDMASAELKGQIESVLPQCEV